MTNIGVGFLITSLGDLEVSLEIKKNLNLVKMRLKLEIKVALFLFGMQPTY